MTWPEAFFWLGLITIVLAFVSFWAIFVFAGRKAEPRVSSESEGRRPCASKHTLDVKVDGDPNRLAKAIEEASKSASKPKPEDFIAIGAKLRNRKTSGDAAPDTKPEGAG